jgi:hypothetical protein
MRTPEWRLLALTLCATAASCDRPPSSASAPAVGPAWFEDMTARSGIRFVHRSSHADKFYLPEIMGGGAALFDMDNDGDLDLYLVQSGSLDSSKPSGHQLYRNRGDGTFDDVTAGSGADVAGYGMGVGAGDYDNDGDVDLLVTALGGNILLAGDGQGHFTDVTGKAGVASSGWNTSAAFLDYDADGWLDLFVVRYLNWQKSAEVECYSLAGTPDYCSPRTYDLPSSSTLFHNNGNGTFTDISDRAGLRGAVGNGLGVVAGDIDGDGRIDVFVANDGTPNHLWMNRGGGRFEEAALLMGTPTTIAISTCSSSTSTANRIPGFATRKRSSAMTRLPLASARRAARSRGSAPRCSISTTTAGLTSTRRTGV